MVRPSFQRAQYLLHEITKYHLLCRSPERFKPLPQAVVLLKDLSLDGPRV